MYLPTLTVTAFEKLLIKLAYILIKKIYKFGWGFTHKLSINKKS